MKHKTGKLKRYMLHAACFMILLALASPALATHGDRIVPCGYSELELDEMRLIPCTPCHLWQLSSNIVNFLLFHLALPILAVAILAGGIVWLTSSGNPKQIELGKNILTSSIIGILIAFGGWLIVDTIIKTLGQGELKWAWNEVGACQEPIVTQPPTGNGTIPPTFINDLEANRATVNLLRNAGVGFLGSASCKNEQGQPVSAATNLGELESSQPLTVCKNGCGATAIVACTKSNFTANPKLLPALFLARQSGINFNITSLSTGDHAQNSRHYTGDAADLVPLQPTQNNYLSLKQQFRGLIGLGPRIECEDNGGNIVANCGSGTTHLHASVK